VNVGGHEDGVLCEAGASWSQLNLFFQLHQFPEGLLIVHLHLSHLGL
jgi:hypothetical protein